MAYMLIHAGATLSDELQRAALPGEATEPYFATGEPCLITVDELTLLGWTRAHGAYQSFATIYQGEWLVALCPHGGTRTLVTA